MDSPSTRDDATPLHAQLERGILAAIAAGRLRPGRSAPDRAQLAVGLRVNANTVAKVYAHLERARDPRNPARRGHLRGRAGRPRRPTRARGSPNCAGSSIVFSPTSRRTASASTTRCRRSRGGANKEHDRGPSDLAVVRETHDPGVRDARDADEHRRGGADADPDRCRHRREHRVARPRGRSSSASRSASRWRRRQRSRKQWERAVVLRLGRYVGLARTRASSGSCRSWMS